MMTTSDEICTAPVPMRHRSVQCMGPHGLHRMAYTEWGDPANPRVLVCVHGLTRNRRDFDYLARALADHYRVVCPDVVGRGESEWLAIKDDYGIPNYAVDLVTLIARLDVEHVHWVGTSMGGLIGMLLASQPATPITRLVLNDIGPLVTVASIGRISEYVGKAPAFTSLDAADAYIREISEPFGVLTDEQWRHLTVHSVRQLPSGGYEMRYDPGIGETFEKSPLVEDVSLWALYDAIRCPTLVLRGSDSDLLQHDTALEMTRRGPMAQLAEVPNVGHAPMLMDAAQIRVVRDFLLAGGAA
jgi:pimeloyl-ACP methyl ester carboxylesterase